MVPSSSSLDTDTSKLHLPELLSLLHKSRQTAHLQTGDTAKRWQQNRMSQQSQYYSPSEDMRKYSMIKIKSSKAMMPQEAIEVTSLFDKMRGVNEKKENNVRKKMIKNLERLVPRNSVGQRKYH